MVYRRYAGLFFAMCIDVTDNELAYLESIHLFVEILDHYFNNVCELDLVFNFHKVRRVEGVGTEIQKSQLMRCHRAMQNVYQLAQDLVFNFDKLGGCLWGALPATSLPAAGLLPTDSMVQMLKRAVRFGCTKCPHLAQRWLWNC